MKRFVILYHGQVHPVRSRSMEILKGNIQKAYAVQDGHEQVRIGRVTMSSTDIANDNYRILDLEDWFREGTKEKRTMTVRFPT